MRMQSDNIIASQKASSLRRHLIVICTISIGIVVSFILYMMVDSWEQEHQRFEFESRVKGYANAVQTSLNANIEALMFLGDFFNTWILHESLPYELLEVNFS